MTGYLATDAAADEEPNNSSRSKRVIDNSDSVVDDGADNELQYPSQPKNKKAMIVTKLTDDEQENVALF
ncbi:hypothetical protein DPMN_132985 [Dreissena polymorpha]|uniref:Uncharacterized protein n=1 Tax=Dreissena polymorpha TaxID=45954 RepID=A0A9D4JEC4_DREPO|nr:hypothetical protein DPMN_132985 [Dreissena polymorpha]